MPAPLIVWDLDCTLGYFHDIELLESLDDPVTVSLRPHIDEALSALSDRGFRHCVLTLASPAYAAIVLSATGLGRHFEAVWGAGERAKGDVEGIGAHFGLAPAEWPTHMLFVGDSLMHDPPRHPEVVFHYEPRALKRDARPLVTLIDTLSTASEPNFFQGFQSLSNRGEGEPVRLTTVEGIGTVHLVHHAGHCPVLCFDDDDALSDACAKHTFRPSEHR